MGWGVVGRVGKKAGREREREQTRVSLESFLYVSLSFPNFILRWSTEVITQGKRFPGHSSSIYRDGNSLK